jgi:phage anti-repressor protein
MPNISQELIPIIRKENEEQLVDARTLHRFLEVDTVFANWIARRIEEFNFIEGRDFFPNLEKSTGGRRAENYSLTLDMAKELSMLERSEKGKQARMYFIEAEKQLRKLRTELLKDYHQSEHILKYCPKRVHNDVLWYASGTLMRLVGKTSHGKGYRAKIARMQQEGTAVMLPDGKVDKWYVREDAIYHLLSVKISQHVSLAIVNLLNAAK